MIVFDEIQEKIEAKKKQQKPQTMMASRTPNDDVTRARTIRRMDGRGGGVGGGGNTRDEGEGVSQ